MRDKLLIKLAHWASHKTRWVMTVVIVLTLLFGALAERLEITLKWADMLPKGDRRTVEYDRILAEFVSASNIVVVVQGEEAQIKAFADSLAPKLLQPLRPPAKPISEGTLVSLIYRWFPQLKPVMPEKKRYVQRVDYKQEVDFLRDHGLILMKSSDLENMADIFHDPQLVPLLTNINNSFEKEYQPTGEQRTRQQANEAYVFLDGIKGWLEMMERYLSGEKVDPLETRAVVDRLMLGEPYFLSFDRKALIMNVIPNFSLMDIDLMVEGTNAVQATIDETLKDFPGVAAGLTGTIAVGRDEMEYSTQSLGYTSVIALVVIGFLLFASFRMWVAPLLALLNLIIGLVWAAGVVSLFVPVMNVMTSMFAVILIGLGIDFSIHIIASFTEMRALGNTIADSARDGLLRSGKGVMTGAVTTASAFLALMIGDSRLMSEMGLATGLGLLVVAATTFVLLPTLLVIRERRWERKSRKKGVREAKPRDISFVFLGRMGAFLKERFPFTILGAVILTILLTISAFDITFDYNYMNIEPEGIRSVTLQDTVQNKFDLSMDLAYLVSESVQESRRLAETARDYGSVALVEDISLYLPSPQEQQKRRPYIKEIYRLMSAAQIGESLTTEDLMSLKDELKRLESNIIELQYLAFGGLQDRLDAKCAELTGDPERGDTLTIFHRLDSLLVVDRDRALTQLSVFQRNFSGYFEESVLRMANTESISLATLPASIVDRYANRERNLFLVTVLPAANMWQDARFLKRFTDDLDEISVRATGMPPVYRALIDIIGRDGRNAAMLTIFLVFAILWIDYRHPGHALMAMIPLLAGVFWMVGIMHLVGRQLDVVNVMGIPIIIGIGIDDGVHIIHRWRREGRGSVRNVFSSTGKAILLTSLTTILAFGSLAFSLWRGYASLGIALSIGVGSCFLTTVVILPGIIGWMESKN